MAPKRQPRVLVIDDDPMTLDISARPLVKADYTVVTAQVMEDALIGFDTARYDLVLTDIFMPGMDGIEGIRRLRQAWPEIKIVAMSAGFSEMSSGSALRAATKIGADAVLPKPFALDDLRDTIARVLADGA
jgi:DNA-binding response OmpR family regulator